MLDVSEALVRGGFLLRIWTPFRQWVGSQNRPWPRLWERGCGFVGAMALVLLTHRLSRLLFGDISCLVLGRAALFFGGVCSAVKASR